MALQGSGQMKMSDIYNEFTGTHDGSQEIQMSDYRDKGDVPASGEIQLATDMYGASNVTYTSATGGTVTTYTADIDGQGSKNYKVHTFTSSGTFAVSSVGTDATISVLCVGGGGGAGGYGGGATRYGGGGGAGGMEYYDYSVPFDNRNLYGQQNYYNEHNSIGRAQKKDITAQNYTVYVGSGGSGGGYDYSGSGGNGSYIRLADGSTYLVIVRGGGGGFSGNYSSSNGGVFGGITGGASDNSNAGGHGGSGGGGIYGNWMSNQYGNSYYYNNTYNTSGDNYVTNTFTSTAAHAGGKAGNGGADGVNATGGQFISGGGGGAGGGGTAGGWYSTSTTGKGGAAKANKIRTGSDVYYAGGAGSRGRNGDNRPSGGNYTGSANTGDGGTGDGNSGGSGIVVIRYVVA